MRLFGNKKEWTDERIIAAMRKAAELGDVELVNYAGYPVRPEDADISTRIRLTEKGRKWVEDYQAGLAK